MNDVFYNGLWRMDWGLGNPNKTAALISTLMVAVWSLAYIKRWGFWLALGLFTILGGCLIHTVSRGGLIAAFLGLVIVIWKTARPWELRKVILVAFSIWVMIGCSIYLNTFSRYGQGVVQEDRSISNRLRLWKVAPSMIVAAPNGWGVGNAGRAYAQWYQPLDDNEIYRTLVNSHLTWMVEFGWFPRFLYLFTWGSVLVLCWPTTRKRWLVIPLGIWIAFGVASIFSSVAESPWLWIVPCLSLAVVLFYRLTRHLWPSSISWLLTAGFAGLICVGFAIVGQNANNLRGSEHTVVVGHGAPTIWLMADEKTLGRDYGKALRRYLQTHPKAETIGVVQSLEDLPPNINLSTLVVAGGLGEAQRKILSHMVSRTERLVLLSPEFYPQELDIGERNTITIKAVFGEFSSSFHAAAWESKGLARRINGVGDFLPAWPELAMEKL